MSRRSKRGRRGNGALRVRRIQEKGLKGREEERKREEKKRKEKGSRIKKWSRGRRRGKATRAMTRACG